jgi:hypothetical protein
MSGKMVGWAVGRRGKGAVSSSLAALMAVLIIAVATVTFLALTGYFTSIAARSGDIERMMMKSREVVKLAIGYDVVREDGQVRFPVRMQLKNAWSGTSEITYVVVLDKQGNVLYERSLDPPLTLYASETRFMRPSQLGPGARPIRRRLVQDEEGDRADNPPHEAREQVHVILRGARRPGTGIFRAAGGNDHRAL